MREWVSINGRLMAPEQAHVSVFDSGFTQGIGLFETMRAYHGRVFRLQQHLDRLRSSARRLGWSVLPDEEVLARAVEQAVSATEQADARVRLTVTTGTLRTDAPDTPQLTVVASAAPGARYPEELYQRGAAVVISNCRQNATDPTTGHKTTSYFNRISSLRAAYAEGGIEAIWLTPEECLAEGAISNIFLVKDNTLLTAPLDTPVLPGITRAAVIELADRQGFRVAEQPVPRQWIHEADEIFLTNALMELMPVVTVDRQPIGTGKPGHVTHQLAGAFGALVETECAHGSST